MFLAREAMNELQRLVDRVNVLNPSAKEKGGYFCLMLKSNEGSTPDLVTRVGEVLPEFKRSSYERSVVACRTLECIRQDWHDSVGPETASDTGAIRTPSGAIVGFAGYRSPWNNALMLAFCVRMEWMTRSDVALLTGEPSRHKTRDCTERLLEPEPLVCGLVPG